MAERQHWFVVGISGVTCGGKTTLAQRLLGALTPAALLQQDKYFLPDDSPRHVPVEGLAHNNYDVLSALDMDAMHSDALAALAGAATAPAPAGARRLLQGKRLLVVEGFSVLNYKPLMELCDLRYYLVLEAGECQARRALRLYEPPDVPGYFERCVWPEHLKYRAEKKTPACVSWTAANRTRSTSSCETWPNWDWCRRSEHRTPTQTPLPHGRCRSGRWCCKTLWWCTCLLSYTVTTGLIEIQ
ncbi:nicotinamide riboside kinase 1 isoform X2 [Hyposmocoma kahamanoa]|uniref:nicotinamide riboside kinase 1 isoform X2 n=1 Tax=Hyposmocoma kahamanoa TaxID=1477025 RepID=UPI000E6D65BE|nr:nicotinamide riboside kinase 1 isoform X2 [Hyposmocoma kahamanoa]